MMATVSSSMFRSTHSVSTWVVTGSTGATFRSMPKRWQALSKAGWAVSGLMTLGRLIDAVLGGVLAVGQHGVADAPGPPGGHQPDRLAVGDRLGVEEVEGHGDDLGLELGGARAHVALEHVDVGEQSEGLVHESVVVVVAAVHGARALARLPGGVLLGGHGVEGLEHLGAGRSLLG